MRSSIIRFATVAGVLLGSAALASAWHARGHEKATTIAVTALGDGQPAVLADHAAAIAQYSNEPDLWTRPFAGAESHKAEAGNQYCDWELLRRAEIRSLPPTREEFTVAVVKAGYKPSQVGYLPYSVVEWTQRLATAMAEHRKWPRDRQIRRKCRMYAGILAHYAQDLCNPLHTTIHYDGRVDANAENPTSPRSGIHLKVDALLGKTPVETSKMARSIEAKPLAFGEGKLLKAVTGELLASHRLVDKVYRLEEKLPDLEKELDPNSPAAEFARERLEASAAFTARLYVTAWAMSKDIELPEWHRRPGEASPGAEEPAKQDQSDKRADQASPADRPDQEDKHRKDTTDDENPSDEP